MRKISKVNLLIKQFGFVFTFKYVYYKVFKKDKKYIALIYKYMNRFLTPLIKEYENRNDISSCFTADDKFPVWVCWWQGADNMPELCKVCYERLQRMLPVNAELHLISSKNYKEYVSIPDYIIRQLEEKKISVTYFSDILRESLLSEHGGLWIDATIFVANKIPGNYFANYKFWSVKIPPCLIDKKYLGQQISNGRWSGFILMGAPGNILNTFVKEAMYLYAQKHDIIIDYFIQNLIISIAYDKVSSIREIIDRIPENNTKIYQLYKIIDDKFDQEVYNELTYDTNFFKLTWKRPYMQKNANEELNFYGYIKSI